MSVAEKVEGRMLQEAEEEGGNILLKKMKVDKEGEDEMGEQEFEEEEKKDLLEKVPDLHDNDDDREREVDGEVDGEGEAGVRRLSDIIEGRNNNNEDEFEGLNNAPIRSQ